jgi:hypothetical protein
MVVMERAAKAAYDEWMAGLGCVEPRWEELDQSHRDRLTASIRAAIAELLGFPGHATWSGADGKQCPTCGHHHQCDSAKPPT